MAEKPASKSAAQGTAKKAAPKGTYGSLSHHSEGKWRKPSKKKSAGGKEK